jgi:hypothetical protein
VFDRAKMRLYDCEQSAQEDIVDSGQDEMEQKTIKKLAEAGSFSDFKF